jgi:BirA family transcriptional regulator, biotin operon repressor / biotin---[acetyl-CoA-carboxylase] ligase
LSSAKSASDRLDADRVRQALGGSTLIGREIVVLEQVASTNDTVFELAREGSTEGLVVFAEYQTAGRGQRGNRWQSPRFKGLCCSILLQPGIPLQDSVRLTRWVAQTIASTVAAALEMDSRVKQPNDVYVNDRKIAGVLVEMRAQPGAPHWAIAGIGLNVNETKPDFPPELCDKATSLAMLTGHQQDRSAIAIALLRNLDRSYGHVRAGCSGPR